MKNIRIYELVTMGKGITSEEGQPIYELIHSALTGGDSVELDFAGMTFMTTAFLNIVIGQLYKDFTSEELRERLIPLNLDKPTSDRIKDVTANAKLFYANQQQFNRNIDEAIYGNQ